MFGCVRVCVCGGRDDEKVRRREKEKRKKESENENELHGGVIHYSAIWSDNVGCIFLTPVE